MTQTDKKQSLFEVCSQRQPEWDPTSTTLDIELMDEAIGLGKATDSSLKDMNQPRINFEQSAPQIVPNRKRNLKFSANLW